MKKEEEEEEEFDERMMVEEEEEQQQQTHVFKRGSVKGEKVKKLSRRSNNLKNPILNTSGDELYLVSYPSLFDELIQEVFVKSNFCYLFDVCFDFGRVS